MIRAKWVVQRPSAEGHHERIIGDLGSLGYDLGRNGVIIHACPFKWNWG